jgi:phosphoserine aminotransferase
MMTLPPKPGLRPANPNFSSGPCTKRPGWTSGVLTNALLGRSHRSKEGVERITEVCDMSRRLLNLPSNYHLGLVGGSDTGAIEMALWTMLGARGVDVLAWESFGGQWVTDVIKQMKLPDARTMEAAYGELPDLSCVNFDNDVVFTWNGTTSGVCVPNGDWIADDRAGLTICDATSAVFAMDIPWHKIDVATYSWQKALGGESQHGVLILSPRAVERLETYTPPWPVPKLFRIVNSGKFPAIFDQGGTMNTPSLLAIEDVRDAMTWAESLGGLPAMIARSQSSFFAIDAWVKETNWVDFIAADPAIRSTTSICLKITAPWFAALSDDGQAWAAKAIVALLEDEGVAYDVGAYRLAPPGLRIWGGSTVEPSDIQALLPWLDWAHATIRADVAKAGKSERASC